MGRTASSISCAISTPSRRAASGVSALCHAQHDLFGHGDAQVVLHELGIAQAGQRPDAGDHRNAELLDALEKALEQAQVEDGLSDGVFRAGLNFVLEAAQLVLDVGHAGIGGHGDGEVGAGADGVASRCRGRDSGGARC